MHRSISEFPGLSKIYVAGFVSTITKKRSGACGTSKNKVQRDFLRTIVVRGKSRFLFHRILTPISAR